MAEQPQSPPNLVQGFKGLNNRVDPTRLGLEYQLQADNVLCDDAGYLVRRPGTAEFATGLKDVYGTHNGRLFAIDDSDNLLEFAETGEFVVRFPAITGAPFQWAELGYALFLMSKTAQWAIYPHQAIPWGSLCPTATLETYPLGDPPSYPPPVGDVLAARRTQLAVGVYEPERDRSVLYFSRPDFPHEFRLEKDYVLLPGRVTMLAALSEGMIIGTDRAIFIDPFDAPLRRAADYGVPLGAAVHDDRDFILFWSERGLCRSAIDRGGLKFENVTDEVLTIQLREGVTTGLLPYQGSVYAVVSQYGDVVPKQLAQPFTPLSISTEYPQNVV